MSIKIRKEKELPKIHKTKGSREYDEFCDAMAGSPGEWVVWETGEKVRAQAAANAIRSRRGKFIPRETEIHSRLTELWGKMPEASE